MSVPSELSFEPLSPINLLARSGEVFADHEAVVDAAARYRVTYGELWERCQRLAGGIRHLGVEPGDRVAVLALNSHLLLEAHFGIPLAGAVIVPLNTRLKAAELAVIIKHSGARVLLHDAVFKATASEVSARLDQGLRCISGGGDSEYETLVDDSPRFRYRVTDELALLAVNYTSGTTGHPKGVMYHHRGGYLQGLAMALHFSLGSDSVYLWTLPMFHCNGWCFPYAVTAAGARHICMDKVEPTKVWEEIARHGVTHLDAAPTVLVDLTEHAPDGRGGGADTVIRIGTGGAPPSPVLLARLADLDIDVTHLYGMTETFGPSVICEWRSEWDDLPDDERARRKARQGVSNVVSGPIRVVDVEGNEVPWDALTIGELTIRGNTVMTGYLNDPEATAAAAPDGWLRTGDLAVRHPDGYVEIRDRAKDVIISGGENISSVEVEQVILTHPEVLEAAVVASKHERWGEVPVAFVAVRPHSSLSEAELIAHVRRGIAHYKAPKKVVFGPLPRTSTGKIQKFTLRQRAQEADDAPQG